MKVPSNRRRLDVFTLDLLEEWTALHGSLVWRQVSASRAGLASHRLSIVVALSRRFDVGYTCRTDLGCIARVSR